MPFLRQSRDKRGYETTYVMHAYRGAQGAAGRTRLLYVFRSPSSRRIGRALFDPEVMEALEHTHPDLTFDWHTMLRNSQMTGEPERDRERGDRGERDRDRRRARQDRGDRTDRNDRPGRTEKPERPERPERKDGRERREVQPAVVLEDDSLLGKTLGAAEAARLRTGFADLQQRILRRSRTPEDRDRLTERAARLNPDEWADEAAIRTGAAGFEAEFDALRQDLPRRRRGRRGGRTREREADGSAIMEPAADSGGANEISAHDDAESNDLDVVGPDGGDAGGLDGGVGAGDDAPAAAGPAAGDPLHDLD